MKITNLCMVTLWDQKQSFNAVNPTLEKCEKLRYERNTERTPAMQSRNWKINLL